MSIQLTSDNVRQRLHSGIELLSEYTDAHTKCVFRCPDGHQWQAKAITVMRGHGCRRCSDIIAAERRKLSGFDVNKRVSIFGKKLVSPYISTTTKARFECAHGHQWYAIPGNVMNGSGCPACSQHGFSPEKSSVFYTLLVTSPVKSFCGFGITRQFNKRMQEHSNTLRKHNLSIVHSQVVSGIGREMIQLEQLVKGIFPTIDAGVAGFHTEAVGLEYFEDVCDIARAFVFTGDAFSDLPHSERL